MHCINYEVRCVRSRLCATRIALWVETPRYHQEETLTVAEQAMLSLCITLVDNLMYQGTSIQWNLLCVGYTNLLWPCAARMEEEPGGEQSDITTRTCQ